jgi:hypothetical protein
LNIKFLSTALTMGTLLNASFGGGTGGSGPVKISRFHGQALIKPIGNDCIFRADIESPEVRLEPKWTSVRKGEYLGEFLLKTGSGSWVHLNERAACVEGDSRLRISSGSDIDVVVERGRLTAVDGRKGPAICKAGQRRTW